MDIKKSIQIHTGGGIITTDMPFDHVMALYELCRVMGGTRGRGGRKVFCIKTVRDVLKCSLREAKAFVDEAVESGGDE